MSGDVLTVGLFAGGVVGGVIVEILKMKQSHFEALRGRTIEVWKFVSIPFLSIHQKNFKDEWYSNARSAEEFFLFSIICVASG